MCVQHLKQCYCLPFPVITSRRKYMRKAETLDRHIQESAGCSTWWEHGVHLGRGRSGGWGVLLVYLQRVLLHIILTCPLSSSLYSEGPGLADLQTFLRHTAHAWFHLFSISSLSEHPHRTSRSPHFNNEIHFKITHQLPYELVFLSPKKIIYLI